MPDRKRLFFVADGPESIELYTSTDEAVCDWAQDIPALYIEASINGALVKLGPFQLKSIRKAVEAALTLQPPPQVEVQHPDTVRLDWLDKYPHLRITTTTINGGQMKHIEGDGTALRASGGDLRDVIDAAMTEPQSRG